MEDQRAPRLIRYLPHMVVTTLVVAVCPTVLAWWLSTDAIASVFVSVVAATAWSLVAASAGGRYWRSRPGAGDVLFGDLMVWGWLRRLWSERRMCSALTLLEGVDGNASVSAVQREAALRALASALEAGDPYTSGHSRRVARHAERIAMGLGLTPREVAKIRTAAILHDIGKVRTPKAILHKPGRLTDEEFTVIKLHPVDGAEMVSILGDAELTAIILHHHERLDGAGYPGGLIGEAIPIGARIIAVADTFDAITSVRPYRQARTHRQALSILEAEAGTQLDREAVKAFERYYTGSRPLAVWMPLASAAQRLTSLLGGGVSAGAGSIARVVLAAGVTSATAAAAVSLPAAGGATNPSHPAGHDAGTELADTGHAVSQASADIPLKGAKATVRRGSTQRRGTKRSSTSRFLHHTRAKVHVVATPSGARPPVYVASAPVVAAPVTGPPVTSNNVGPTTTPPAHPSVPPTPSTPNGSGGPVGKQAGHGKPKKGKPDKGTTGGASTGKGTGGSGKAKHSGGKAGSAGNSGTGKAGTGKAHGGTGTGTGTGTGKSGSGSTGSGSGHAKGTGGTGTGTGTGKGTGGTGTSNGTGGSGTGGTGKGGTGTGSTGTGKGTGGTGSGTGGTGSGNGGSGTGTSTGNGSSTTGQSNGSSSTGKAGGGSGSTTNGKGH